MGPRTLHRSTDGGIAWRNVSAPTVSFSLLAANPKRAGALHVASAGTVFFTADGGVTWAQQTLPGTVIGIAADDVAVAALARRQDRPSQAPTWTIHWSEDGGETFPWTTGAGIAEPRLQFDPHDSGSLYYISLGALARVTRTPTELAIDRRSSAVPLRTFGFQTGLPGVVWAPGVLRSADGGVTWTPQPTIPALRIPATEFVVGAGGVLHFAGSDPTLELQAYVAKLSADGAIEYLTYLGLGRVDSFLRLPNGTIAVAGSTDTRSYPGQVIELTPPGPIDQAAPGFFAAVFRDDGADTLAYSVALSAARIGTLEWVGAGRGAELTIVGGAAADDRAESLFWGRIAP
jgi:hypothetical protein